MAFSGIQDVSCYIDGMYALGISKIAMLRPLDPRMLEALSREGDIDEELDFDPYDHINNIREHIREGGDCTLDVWELLQEGGRFASLIQREKAMIYEEKMDYDAWYIKFFVRTASYLVAHATTKSSSTHRKILSET